MQGNPLRSSGAKREVLRSRIEMSRLTQFDNTFMIPIGIDRFRRPISQWALSFPAIHRVWLFGSRVKGNDRPDSDLDIAVEIDPSVFRSSGDDPYFYWILVSPSMKAKLTLLINVPPQIQQYHSTELEVFSAVQDHGILVYEKST